MDDILADFVQRYNIGEKDAKALQSCAPEIQMKVLMAVFRRKYSIDERAAQFLESCSLDVKIKVLSSFDPRMQADTQDYSKKLMAYIRSVQNPGSDAASEGGGQKRSRDEMEELLHSLGVEEAFSTGDGTELSSFRERYPMDDRAFDFLSSSSPSVKERVLRSFNPRSTSDSDYSGLVTSFVRKVRTEIDRLEGASQPAHEINAAGHSVELLGADDERPSLEQLQEFRNRYPMDDRAWEYLNSSSGSAQAKILVDFKPRNPSDTDYSAAVTYFLRAVKGRPGAFAGGAAPLLPGAAVAVDTGTTAPDPAQLEEFRARFPMDDRAFEFLTSSSAAVQVDILQNFAPGDIKDGDYSRPMTSYIKQVRSKHDVNAKRAAVMQAMRQNPTQMQPLQQVQQQPLGGAAQVLLMQQLQQALQQQPQQQPLQLQPQPVQPQLTQPLGAVSNLLLQLLLTRPGIGAPVNLQQPSGGGLTAVGAASPLLQLQSLLQPQQAPVGLSIPGQRGV
eukprot:TRINITY_DN18534_c0_g1_i2.p1 TRINITY_DN18534_c0_g1~~TRINITY_DN18534_c0_g1_i2.p1  ORF type:complete len:503 (+),score=99.36 TRINITY_DN18534_c0_g1_i2:29-1537(+)